VIAGTVDEGQRIPAAALESLITRRIRDWLSEPTVVLQVVQKAVSDAVTQRRLIGRAKDFAKLDYDRGIEGLRAFMRSSIMRVQVYVDHIDIIMDQDWV